MLTDEGREFQGLAFQHLEPGRRDWVETPERDVDEVAGSADGRVLAWTENLDGWARVRVRDLERGEDLPEPRLPQGTGSPAGSGLALSRDGSRLALVWDQPGRPPEVYVVETATGEARPVTESRLGGLRSLRLREPELVSYPSFDGREIPAWLYRPEGEGPAPFVLAIHGGPEAQERPIYRPVYQYLLSRGIGVLATNIRGSTGYGKTYQKLIHHDWGGGDLEDWRHAAEWLRAQDAVDGGRLGVYGGSYGGFATLSCVTRLPEYWAAAVDIVGPANLLTFVRAVPPTWLRFMAKWVGDPRDRGGVPARALADHLRRPGARAAARPPGRERPARRQVRVRPDGGAAAGARPRGRVRRLRGRGSRLHALRERGARRTG